jgi:hypothetical protein
MKLAQLQADFQHILLDTQCRDANWVAETDHGISSHQRVGIYYNAYRIRLIEVLNDTFEHTATYLGGEWFNNLAASYVQENTSTHNNIGLYGKWFSAHLARELPDDLEVAELAHMDWSLRRAFDGANADVVTQNKLAELAAAGNLGQLSPVPTLTISIQQFNTLDIWHAINEDKTPPVVAKLPEPVNILMWRKGHSPHFRSLSPIESAAVAYLCAGHGLESIAEMLAEDFPEEDIAAAFGMMIARWLEDELLAV